VREEGSFSRIDNNCIFIDIFTFGKFGFYDDEKSIEEDMLIREPIDVITGSRVY
jgi:hypothetical protein